MVFKVIRRILGSFFQKLGRTALTFFRWLNRHEAGLGIITVAALVVVGLWLVLSVLNINIVFGTPQAVSAPVATSTNAQPVATPLPPTPLPAPTPVPVDRTSAPAATEAFMTGEVNGNADQIWEALSANLRTELAGKNQDKTYYQRLFDSLKKAGVSYTGYQYIGGVNNDNGTSLQFYVLTMIDKDKKTTRVPYNFVVDSKDGHILSITSI